MSTENDERLKDDQKMSFENYILKMIDDKRIENDVEKWNTMPLNLGAFIISTSIRIMNILIHTYNGFNSNDL